jgi:hypothetical protein
MYCIMTADGSSIVLIKAKLRVGDVKCVSVIRSELSFCMLMRHFRNCQLKIDVTLKSGGLVAVARSPSLQTRFLYPLDASNTSYLGCTNGQSGAPGWLVNLPQSHDPGT